MLYTTLLIVAKSGCEQDIKKSLLVFHEVKEVLIVYGEFDIVAKIQVQDVNELNEFMLSRVRPIPHIEKTTTLISAV